MKQKLKDTLSSALFSNGHIKIDKLLRIARDELSLPVSSVRTGTRRQKSDGECAGSQRGDYPPKRRRLLPPKAQVAGEGGGCKSGQGSGGELM